MAPLCVTMELLASQIAVMWHCVCLVWWWVYFLCIPSIVGVSAISFMIMPLWVLTLCV